MWRAISFRREPAIWIGVVASLLLLVQSAMAGQIDWVQAIQDAVPLLASLIIRSRVSPV